MIFSELYSVYYHTVANILAKALESNMTEKELQQQVLENAFSESVLTITPALKSGRWPLLKSDLTSVLYRKPAMPLTILEKRWIKAIMNDPRIRLFGVEMPDLEEIEPLFTCDDYKVYDQYADGDPYERENYIQHFRLILSAIKEKRPVKITMINRHGKEVWVRCYPKGFEYSLKDDKIRILATRCRFKQFNLGRVIHCEYYTGKGPWHERPKEEFRKDLTLMITDKRNALERAMLHFAHFEKQAERVDEEHYTLQLKYYENDETELVIRILSFGPYVQVVEPESVRNLIKDRLISQKSCDLR